MTSTDDHPGQQIDPDAVRVDARPWEHGWELYVLGSSDLVTQVEDLEDAPAQARDLMETWFPGADFSRVKFAVRTPA